MTTVYTEPSSETLTDSSTEGATDIPVTPRRGKRGKGRGIVAVARSVVFWSHVVMGVAGGLIILVMSVTGAILGFERQLVARFDGIAKAVPPSATSERLPLDTLLVRNTIEVAGVASVVIKADRTDPVSVRFREREKPAQLVDPYSGAAIAPIPRGKTAEFMSWLRGWHRWLGVTGERRPLMRTFTGAANIAFLLLVLSGLYIWWPKRLTKAAFKTAAVFNPRLSGKARDFNWHNSLGFWSAIPLAFVILTGVFISYSWPGQWMDRLWGSEKERAAAIKAMNTPSVPEGEARGAGPAGAARDGGSRDGASRDGASRASVPTRTLASLDAMTLTVQHTHPEWQSITVTPPGPKDSVVQLAVAEGNTYRPDLKTQYFFDAKSGALRGTTTFDSLSTSRKIRGWTRFGHTGEIFDLTGQAIATFVSVVGAILVYTGLALGWRRMLAFVRRMRRASLAESRVVA